jgi:NADH dehydrogenase FAD-containing subunit
MIGVLLLLLMLDRVDSLSTATLSSESPPVERVAIIGSGIAGLSLAHALTNCPELLAKSTPGSRIQVSLFDSRPSFDFNAGAGVQLNG